MRTWTGTSRIEKPWSRGVITGHISPMKTIPLTQGKVALVDDRDYEKLSKHKWYARRRLHLFYAGRNVVIGGKKTTILMHRAILTPTAHQDVDHRDRNGLNNTRKNLRIATDPQNQGNARKRADNTSGFKGVTFHPQLKRWWARIWFGGKRHSLGTHHSPEEAHIAYCAAATRLHKEFARFA